MIFPSTIQVNTLKPLPVIVNFIEATDPVLLIETDPGGVTVRLPLSSAGVSVIAAVPPIWIGGVTVGLAGFLQDTMIRAVVMTTVKVIKFFIFLFRF
jgi:hypothetical protein